MSVFISVALKCSCKTGNAEYRCRMGTRLRSGPGIRDNDTTRAWVLVSMNWMCDAREIWGAGCVTGTHRCSVYVHAADGLSFHQIIDRGAWAHCRHDGHVWRIMKFLLMRIFLSYSSKFFETRRDCDWLTKNPLYFVEILCRLQYFTYYTCIFRNSTLYAFPN